ncbi:MAG: guanylate kinase [Candidatus Cloacimonadota bacterium]|nr:MAG: guanylate kinase [Candidatus Cloacimonadota bacterium]PIE79209.1 MAG: guanylate kinase [Candidatus Delongbacteria bacterium]
MNKGKIIVFSAPSGGGKTTIINSLMEKYKTLNYSISATTRAKRGNEVNGKNYFFLTENEFKKKIEEGSFVEYKNVYGNYYGTLKSYISESIENGKNIVLDIDVQGAKAVKEIFPNDSILIFITPPSLEVLKKRLINRGEDDLETIEKRLNFAENEIKESKFYDYIVINDILEDSILKCEDILKKLNLL